MSVATREAVLGLLDTYDSWWTPQEIANRVDIAPSTARNDLLTLMRAGLVERRQIRNALHYRRSGSGGVA